MYALPPERCCPPQDHASALASLKKLCALRAQSSGLPSACQFGSLEYWWLAVLQQYCQYALDTHDARVERRTRVARKVGRSFVFCVGSLTYLSALLLYLVTFNAVGNEFAVRCD